MKSILQLRSLDIFPVLEAAEIERLRRFGMIRCYGAGDALATVGGVSEGLMIVLVGRVEVTRRGDRGRAEPIPGQFLGELAQPAGRPALGRRNRVGGSASADHRAGPAALMIAEAELGEMIMRALILRRVGILETGAGGPVIVGRAENADVRHRRCPDRLAAPIQYNGRA
jgi:thioredoxin reductase (NADPH)